MCVYIRDLTLEEGNQIQRTLRHGRNAIYVRRCQVILASDQGMKVPKIASNYYLSEEYVRQLIRTFNEGGLEALKPKKPGKSLPTFTEEQKAEIIELALMPPQICGLPFTQWSLKKLRDEVVRRSIMKTISHEKIRQILEENRISYQRTKTWKESNDPEFEVKKKE